MASEPSNVAIEPDNSGIVAATIFLVIGCMLTFLLVGRGSPDLTQDDVSLNISGSGYGRTIRYDEIDSVRLRWNLDGLGAKIGALQNGNDYRGSFAMRPYGRASLFVDARTKPFVEIFSTNGVTIVSAADSLSAERLLRTLRDKSRR